jgi:23S rRNA pseudouridine1911/1915/1917 synthase
VAKRTLQGKWEEVHKKYRVIVEGIPRKAKGQITSYLRETKALRVYSVGADNGEGKYAMTGYEVVTVGNDYALLEITLVTGRKNQIRVHMADMGHPVAGDKKYGARTDPMGRLGLHAYSLAFPQPTTGKLLEFTSKMPGKFEALFLNKAGGKVFK